MNVNDERYWTKPLSLNQALDFLESLSDDDEIPTEVILMPTNIGNEVSDEESGDEDEININHLSGKTLATDVALAYDKDISQQNNDESVLQTIEDDENDENEDNPPPSKKRTAGKLPALDQNWRTCKNEQKIELISNYYNNVTYMPPTTLGAHSTPLDIFLLFWDSDFVTNVAYESVMYAKSRNRSSVDITSDDIYAMLGVLIVSSYVPLPRRKMYWENRVDTHNELISKYMRRNKFVDVFTNLHFTDNKDVINNDKLFKIRKLIDHLNDKFIRFAPFESNLAIDESMIPYYGRHSCKQFMKCKPIRFGFKSWVLAQRLGYCMQFDIYQGRSESNESQYGLGESVVLKFARKLKDYYNIPFSLFFDNFFTSYRVIHELNELGFGGTGTVRCNRLRNIPIPNDKTMKKEVRGYSVSFENKEKTMLTTCWKDNKPVTILSNQFGREPLSKANRYIRTDRKRADISMPNCIKQYNNFMGGVDQLDNNVSNYRINIRGKKWYMPIVLWLIDISVCNAWMLHRLVNEKNQQLDQLEFRRRLADELLSRYGCEPQKPGPSRTSTFSKFGKGSHVIIRSEGRLQCKLCTIKTYTMCPNCNVHLHAKCFEKFHQE